MQLRLGSVNLIAFGILPSDQCPGRSKSYCHLSSSLLHYTLGVGAHLPLSSLLVIGGPILAEPSIDVDRRQGSGTTVHNHRHGGDCARCDRH